jgi:hypothetical protein
MALSSKAQDKLINKRGMLMDAIQQKQTLIRELGSLPRKELDEFQGKSENSLLATLRDVNERLKVFSGRYIWRIYRIFIDVFFFIISGRC